MRNDLEATGALATRRVALRVPFPGNDSVNAK
jgi:hypothetical protein